MADCKVSQKLSDRVSSGVFGLENIVKLVHVVDVELHAGDARALELHHVLSQRSGLVGKHVLDLAKFLHLNNFMFMIMKNS
jgi:hypothetical protein